ncbi:MAG: pyridoxamine 5'-phosphate oxidase family protein [Candidatus Rokuibacteriota bacterium]
MSPRRDIRLTPEEQDRFLRDASKAALATVDKDGFPHVVAMSFVARDGVIYMTSYAKAQKVVNARRNPRVAVMIETGGEYSEFHGVMIRGRCEVIEDPAQVERIIQESAGKRAGIGVTPPPGSGALASAPKRVVLKVTPEKIASWDHRKLGGRY